MVWICFWILHGLEYLYYVNIILVYCHVVLLLYVIVTQLYQGWNPTQCYCKPKSHRASIYDTGL